MIKTRTIKVVNGIEKELKNYDRFVEWSENIMQKFIDCKDYKGYPLLPDIWLDGMEIYEKADDEEKRWITRHATNMLVEILRHWKVDRDNLYGKDGWKRFL